MKFCVALQSRGCLDLLCIPPVVLWCPWILLLRWLQWYFNLFSCTSCAVSVTSVSRILFCCHGVFTSRSLQMKTIYSKNVYCLWGQAKKLRAIQLTLLLFCFRKQKHWVPKSRALSPSRWGGYRLHLWKKAWTNPLTLQPFFDAVNLWIMYCMCDRICPTEILAEFQ